MRPLSALFSFFNFSFKCKDFAIRLLVSGKGASRFVVCRTVFLRTETGDSRAFAEAKCQIVKSREVGFIRQEGG